MIYDRYPHIHVIVYNYIQDVIHRDPVAIPSETQFWNLLPNFKYIYIKN